jgi:protein-S-isoprenylcysteine O-methyltransferase Ste14
MRQTVSALGSAVFLVIAPGVIAGLVPWWISRWEVRTPLFGQSLVSGIGVLLVLAGLPVLLESFARFAWQGHGTPAPVFPARRLVVGGFYRHVRNPMYVAVVALILGQAAIFANVHLLIYGALIWAAFHGFVLLHEEPKLRESFGPEYENYRAHVSRWLPRLRPWKAA